jgi:cytochrome c peroxidase
VGARQDAELSASHSKSALKTKIIIERLFLSSQLHWNASILVELPRLNNPGASKLDSLGFPSPREGGDRLTIAKQRAFLLAAAGFLLVAQAALLLQGCGGGAAATTTTTTAGNPIPSLQPYPTPSGTESTYVATGSIDPNSIFFQQLGTNARSCSSCHQLSQGMGLSAASAQALFTSSNGTDPLFLAVDGANCPTAAAGDSTAHSLVLNNGLIRIAETLPSATQFTMAVAQDPYGCAATANASTGQTAYSVYRRPLPATSLTFLSQVMWDARFTASPLNVAGTLSANLQSDLSSQAANAIATHEQGSAASTPAQLSELVAFEEGLFTAEATDSQAGSLTGSGATGGASALAEQKTYPGINDAFGQDPSGAAFNPVVFTLFAAWEGSSNPAQASIARGEDIFNSAPMQITDVHGLNDNSALGSPAVIVGTCGTCHDTPNVGTHSLPLAMDIGISHVIASETDANIIGGLQALTIPSLPVYQISGCTDAGGNAVVYVTTDPGVALTTGQCADVNRMKVPGLRGLAARGPYFHNGSAANLGQLVQFYSTRFQMNLNPQQLVDLQNFLAAL